MSALGTIAAKVGKKILVDIAFEPENIIKWIFGILFVLVIIIIVFCLPIILIVSTPFLLLDTGSPEVSEKQELIIEQYQVIQNELYDEAEKWIYNEKRDYNTDYTSTSNKFSIEWEELVAIDSVLLKQDFSKYNKEDIMKIGRKFMDKTSYERSYYEEEEYEEEYIDPKTKKKKKRTRTRLVLKSKAVIKIKKKSFKSVIESLDLDDDDESTIVRIYKTMKANRKENENKQLKSELDKWKRFHINYII